MPLRPLGKLCLVVSLFAACAFAQSDFTIIALPDTQNEAQFYPQVMNSQMQWIVNNRAALNIQVVLGEGDIVNNGSDDLQQANADAAYKLLDNAGIPYFAAIGNHDYDNVSPSSRSTIGFDKWFGPQRYASYPWYLGNFPSGSNANFYGELNINGNNYLFLALEYVPRTTALNWAASILQANPDKEAMIVTHSFMYSDNTRVDRCDTNDMAKDNDGDESWAALESQYPNISLVVSGHVTSGQTAHRNDIGVNGNLVNQVFTNYQTFPNGGNGWLRIFTFHPATDTIDVKTYSPYLNSYRTDSANQFTMPWHKPDTSQLTTGTISGLVRDSGNCNAISSVTVTAGGAAATTDSKGHYSLTLPAGSYSVSTDAAGYNDAQKNATVNNGFDADTNFYLNASAPATCTLNTTSPSVTICTPKNNATVTSPVHIVAGTTDTAHSVTLIQIYVDGVSAFTANGGSLDTSVAMATGTRRLTVQAKDSAGTIFKQTIYVTVGSGSSGSFSVSPTSLSFGSQQTGITSSAKSVTVSNGTSSAVTMTSIATTGDFTQSNNCGTSLAAGASCTASVTFTPSATGSRTGTLTFTDSASGSPQTVSLSGNGTTTSGSCTPSTVNQSVVICTPTNGATVSSPVAISAVATGSGGVKYIQAYVDGVAKVTQNGATLNASVAMTNGSHRLTVQAKDNAGTTFKSTINITVGAATGSFSISPSSLTFASQTVGTTSTSKSVTLNNGTASTVSISSIAASGDFAQTNTCGTSLAAGASCSVSVTFSPTATGTRNGTLTLTDSDATSPQSVSLTGTGASAGTFSVSPTSLSFASQAIGTTAAPKSVSVSNGGATAVSFNSIVAGGDFAQTNNCGTSLAAGASCSVSVTFTPTATGTRTGALTLTDSDASSPQTVSLSGSGTSTTSCAPSSVNQTVVICSPANGATVSSPVTISAVATDSTGVKYIQAYVDGVAKFTESGAKLNTSLAMTSGTHRLTVQAKNTAGVTFKSTINITVQ